MSTIISPSKRKNRRYVLGKDVHVCSIDSGQIVAEGVLPAGSLIRNDRLTDPRTNPEFKVLFEASTDNGKTWYSCGAHDLFTSYRH